MPHYGYGCMDCNHVFTVDLTIEEFEANPNIECPQCQSDNVQSLNIKECMECEEIWQLQKAHHINVAPLFWQGRGRKNIPLVLIGINPSVVGTNNEPKRRICDFKSYFDYYQNRAASEDENIRLAKERKRIYGANFCVEEFKDGFTIENLCNTLQQNDTFNLENSTIEALNALLKQSGLYEKLIAANQNREPSKKLQDNIASYKKKKEEKKLKKINRLALEEYYSQETPKIPNVPKRYWTICYTLSKKNFIEGERWENYVLMEAIHCFFNRITDLKPDEINAVAAQCFERHTKKILMELKPRKMILLGNEPYKVFRQYAKLKKEINKYEYCALNVNGLRIPVLRHPHPSDFNDDPFYRPDIYDDFNRYCDDFDYGE